jgi:Zn-finger nucleic acid-binding protein
MTALRVAPPGGGQVELDSCDGCGGIWFDLGELQQASKRKPMREKTGQQTDQSCPRCDQPLFEDTFSGKAGQGYSCRHCHGVFMTKAGVDQHLSLHAGDAPGGGLPGDDGAVCEECDALADYVTQRNGKWVCSGCIDAKDQAASDQRWSIAASVGSFFLSVILNSDD